MDFTIIADAAYKILLLTKFLCKINFRLILFYHYHNRINYLNLIIVNNLLIK